MASLSGKLLRKVPVSSVPSESTFPVCVESTEENSHSANEVSLQAVVSDISETCIQRCMKIEESEEESAVKKVECPVNRLEGVGVGNNHSVNVKKKNWTYCRMLRIAKDYSDLHYKGTFKDKSLPVPISRPKWPRVQIECPVCCTSCSSVSSAFLKLLYHLPRRHTDTLKELVPSIRDKYAAHIKHMERKVSSAKKGKRNLSDIRSSNKE